MVELLKKTESTVRSINNIEEALHHVCNFVVMAYP